MKHRYKQMGRAETATGRTEHAGLPLLGLLACLLLALGLTVALTACQPTQPGGEETSREESPSDLPGTNDPGTDDPGTDVPGTDVPGTDESGTEGTPSDTAKPSETGYDTDESDSQPTESGSQEQPTESETAKEDLYHPGDASAYEGLMIAMVFGTGKKNTDASISHGFVQLYNANEEAMSLNGVSLYYKSDDAKPYEQLVFPDTAIIPGNGYFLIRANSPDGYDESMAILSVEDYDLAWDVYIDNKEVRLVLAPSGWAISAQDDITGFDDAISVFYASETYKYSVMAVDDLSKDKVAVRTALTPYSGYHTVKLSEAATAELNRLRTVTSIDMVNPLIGSRLNEVYFSQPAGIYESTVNLQLSAGDGYTIYYTIDGSDPTTSSSRRKYQAAISLASSASLPWGTTIKTWASMNGNARPVDSTLPGGYVIKAYATNGQESTAVFTNTYFILPDLTDYGVTVISLSIPVSEMLGSGGFYSNYCPTGIITDPRPRGLAMMEVFDTTGQRVGHSQVELAVSGNGSSGFAMKSLRIYYKGENNQAGGLESDLNYDLSGGTVLNSRGEAITSFSRLLLRNSGNDCGTSYIRDAFMQSTCAGLNVDYMASASTLVFVNGEFWGVYNIRERYSPEYVESHYGVDKENVALIESDYSQVHTNQNAPFVLSSGVEGDQDPFNELVAYMRATNLSDPAAYQKVCEQMDIDSFIDMWVCRLFYVARDWPENNIKVWRNKNPDDPSGMDTKWHFTLLDMDMGLSFYDFTTENENFFWAFDSNSVCGAMMRSLMRNEDFKNQFILRYYQLVTEHFTAEALSAAFEELYAERTPLMSLQARRWGNEGASVNTWNRAATAIRSFIQKRQSIALQHMYAYFGITESDIENMSSRRVIVSFNDARAAVSINGSSMENGTTLRFEGESLTMKVKVTAKDGVTLTSLSWIGTDGKTQTVELSGTSAEVSLTVTSSGSLAVYSKRESSGEAVSTDGTLTAGATYLFYLDENGDLYAWGDNRNGVLGLNSTKATVTTPTLVRSDVAKVATTNSSDYENGSTSWMTAILTKDGKLYTVGANGSGQLGRGGTTTSTRLGLVSFNGIIVDVSVGHDHMLILDDQGTLWGVGNNAYGQLGSTAGSSSQTFVRIADHVSLISAGRRTTVYVDENGNLFGLGDNRWNKMIAGVSDRLTKPTLLLENVVFISSGEHEMVAVTENGDLYYAGWRDFNSFSQGGGNTPAMQKVMGGVVSASIYFSDMVILTENGDAYVYGLNTGSSIVSATTGGSPRKLLSGVVSEAAGYGFTAYLKEDGTILVQGDNSYGQAGNGRTGGTVSLGEVIM